MGIETCLLNRLILELAVCFQVLDGKEELEKQHRESIKKLNVVVERQERESTKVQSELEEFLEKNRSLQAALDNSYKYDDHENV